MLAFVRTQSAQMDFVGGGRVVFGLVGGLTTGSNVDILPSELWDNDRKLARC